MLCTADFEAHAREVLTKETWDYYAGGSNNEQTLKENVIAFSRYRLRPRVLRGVSDFDMSTDLLGEKVMFPVGISPTAFHCMAHTDGELATARASSKLKTCNIISNFSSTSMEDIIEASGSGLNWLQTALYGDKYYVLQLVQQAERLGVKALVVTVDTPVLGKRVTSIRNHFSPPKTAFPLFKDIKFEQTANTSGFFQYIHTKLKNPSQSWQDLDWLRSCTQLPIILKGILTAEDAKEALKHNIQGIMVSNHGGRQLDGVPATIDVLSEVVRAVKGQVEVYMDGGVRQGTDVLKALALGARAVFIGRPVLWGLAHNGEDGVSQVLQMLRDELKQAMILCGCSNLSEIKPELIVHQSFYKI